MTHWWLDKTGQPIDVARWGELRFTDDGLTDYARIGFDEIHGASVSTVWLGINHNFGGGPPILFETMIFGYQNDDDGNNPMMRYHTEGEAAEGHVRTVADLRAGRVPWFMAVGGYDLGQERCPVCENAWHGLDDPQTGCPGEFASEIAIKEWKRRHYGS